jgi:hypothetical protein
VVESAAATNEAGTGSATGWVHRQLRAWGDKLVDVAERLLYVCCVCSGILPVLKPIFEQADGEVLLALVKHLAVFYSLMPR